MSILVLSLLTNHEFSIAKIIPMRAHLAIDSVASIMLAASPFLFGFSDDPANVWLPHVVFGLGYLIISLLTEHTHRRETTRVQV
jgi:hypothetical protein